MTDPVDPGKARAKAAGERAKAKKQPSPEPGAGEWRDPNWREKAEIPELDREKIEDFVRSAVDGMRQRVARDLQSRAVTAAQRAAADQFSTQAVAQDMEVFALSAGLKLLLMKYRLLMAEWAPEFLTAGGLLLVAINQVALRRAAREIAEQWEREASPS